MEHARGQKGYIRALCGTYRKVPTGKEANAELQAERHGRPHRQSEQNQPLILENAVEWGCPGRHN